MSKHIKLRREPKQFWPADKYGDDIEWWHGVEPMGAMDFASRSRLADHLIHNKHDKTTIYVVSRSFITVMLYRYDVNIHLAHILVNTNLLVFENYWLAHGFKVRLQKKLTELFGR